MKITCIAIIVCAAAAVVYSMFKSGHFIKSLTTSVLHGITSLMAVNVLGLITGVTVAVNWYTLLTVSVFGIPSTAALVLLDAFLV